MVAPYAGAWIEILEVAEMLEIEHVAPYAGAWIEISYLLTCWVVSPCRSLRGSVD